MKTTATLVLALAITGCAPAMEAAFGPTPHKAARMERERLRAQADAKCQEFGFKPGTKDYAYCRLRLEEAYSPKTTVSPDDGDRRAAPPSQGNAFMCKDAISRGDRGAIFIFC